MERYTVKYMGGEYYIIDNKNNNNNILLRGPLNECMILKQYFNNYEEKIKENQKEIVKYEDYVFRVLRNHFLECKKWNDIHGRLIVEQIAMDLNIDKFKGDDLNE